MKDPNHPTNQAWEMNDPEVDPPPIGVTLLVLNEGGCLIASSWYEGAQAWCYKPSVPEAVKARMSLKSCGRA